MSQEIYYTSAPRGLKPGSRDYCTVARTQGMSDLLADQLEGLSGYRILFLPNDPRADRNPVAWSYVRIPHGGRLISVLSRIGASGLDYTGRTNKFAHHVALDDGERPEGGPAWLLSQPGFMVSSWNGHVGALPDSRMLPQGDFAPRPAAAWQAAVGDAGWAGVVAEAFLADPKRLVYVIFAPGTDLLPLFAEAHALLPPGQRWDAGFITFYTNLPPGIACPWRGIVADSPEADEARRLPQALIVDLTGPLGPARGGALVEQARSGVRPPPRVVPPPLPSRAPAPPIPSMLESDPQPQRQPLRNEPQPARGTTTARAPVPYDLVIPATPPPLTKPAPPPLRRSREPQPRSTMLATVLTSAAVSLTIVLGGLYFGMSYFKTAPTTTIAQNDNLESTTAPQGGADGNPVTAPTEEKKDQDKAALKKKDGSHQGKSPAQGTKEKDQVARKDKEASGDDSPLMKGTTDSNQNKEPTKDKRIGDAKTAPGASKDGGQSTDGKSPKESAKPIREESYKFRTATLPPFPTGAGNGQQAAEILGGELPEGVNCSLKILGLTDAELNVSDRKIEEMPPGPAKKITIRFTDDRGPPLELAQFWIEGRKVLFRWGPVGDKSGTKKIADALRECVLVVQPEQHEPWHVLLREPASSEKKPLNFGRDDMRTLSWGAAGRPRRALKLGPCRLVLKPREEPVPNLPTKWESTPPNSTMEGPGWRLVLFTPNPPKDQKPIRPVALKVELKKPNPEASTKPGTKNVSNPDDSTPVKAWFETAHAEYERRLKEVDQMIKECDDEVGRLNSAAAAPKMSGIPEAAAQAKKQEITKRTALTATQDKLKHAVVLIKNVVKHYELVVPLMITVGGGEYEIARIGPPDVEPADVKASVNGTGNE